jgi:hypothetical protein
MSSQNCYYCSLCVQGRPYYAFLELLRHLQFAHNGQSDFKVQCELGPLYGNIYSTFAGYKTHIYRDHRDLLGNDLCKQGMHLNANTHNSQTLPSTSWD